MQRRSLTIALMQINLARSPSVPAMFVPQLASDKR